ncbi:lysozyme g-like [Mixophyes fleayi]|uniref:lysozyme g-like n=1 Tax=Mixophyes fleayi TaxID=3061075 RepID=UPI003F4D80C3
MTSKYGDLSKIPTSGASYNTGKQYVDGSGKTYKGIKASEKLAGEDQHRMIEYKGKIQSVAEDTDMDPAIIAGIISRESRAGNVLGSDFWDAEHLAFGLMQVDRRHHQICAGAGDSEEHISQGTKILCAIFDDVEKKFPTWTTEQHMKGAIAAYNQGYHKIKNFATVDSHTTFQDYSNDVVARAKYFKRRGY